jgi:hypothetical protein
MMYPILKEEEAPNTLHRHCERERPWALRVELLFVSAGGMR